MKSACFAPTLTQTCSGSGRHPRLRAVGAQIASFRGGDARDRRVLRRTLVDGALRGVEHEARRLEVRLADAEREHVDARARSSVARAFIASVMLGATASRRLASVKGKLAAPPSPTLLFPSSRRGRRGVLLGEALGVVVTLLEPLLEVLDALPQAFADVCDAARTEEEQRNQRDDQQLARSDATHDSFR